MKKSNKIGLIVFCIIVGSLLLKFGLEAYNISRNGVYVLAKLKSIGSVSKNGRTKFYVYHYAGKIYEKGILNPDSDSLLFFKIYVNNPNEFQVVSDHDVPYSMKFTDMPKEGWKDLPIK